MKVTHLACTAPPQIGGIGQVAYDEVVGLCERGVKAVLISSQSGSANVPGIKQEVNADIIRLPTYIQVGNAAVVRGLDRMVADADILHLHYPWYGVAERLLLAPPKKPTVVTFHMDAQADDWRGGMFSLHRRLIQPRLLRHATRILVSSRDYAEHSSLTSLIPELKNKIIQLPFALDTDFFSPQKNVIQSLEDDAQIFFVGGLDKAHHFKGLSLLLQAMVRLPPSVKLTIVGDGEERPAFEREVQAGGLVSRVTFLGRLSREALRDAYRDAHVLAFPSMSAAEAFGLVALEAQACGVPVVASRLPGVRTVVRDGETGILVTPGSVPELTHGLATLLKDQEKRQEYAKNARDHVYQRFSQKTHIDKLIEVYQAL